MQWLPFSPEVRSSGQAVYGNSNWPTTIYGGNEQYLDIKSWKIVNGRNLTDSEARGSAKVCLIGHTVAGSSLARVLTQP